MNPLWKSRRRKDPSNQTPGLSTGSLDGESIVKIDIDQFSPQSRDALEQEFVRRTGFPLFEGRVTHGYTKSFVRDTATCPRCQSATRRCAAHFIYVTDQACRAMLASAGYFCASCPTVIVDEAFIAAGVAAGYRFRRVVGIDHDAGKDPDYFSTWNGENPVFVLDENEQILDMWVKSEMKTPPFGPPSARPPDRKKSKAKRKQSDRSRRRNRKK